MLNFSIVCRGYTRSVVNKSLTSGVRAQNERSKGKIRHAVGVHALSVTSIPEAEREPARTRLSARREAHPSDKMDATPAPTSILRLSNPEAAFLAAEQVEDAARKKSLTNTRVS